MPERERSITDTIAGKHCWWTISSEAILGMLDRAYAGEDPKRIYAEAYLESDLGDFSDAS